MRTPILQTSQAGGELGPDLQARTNLEAFFRTCKRAINNVIDNSGQTRFRPGTYYAANTRLNGTGFMQPFVFNVSQAYNLDFTHLKMRVFKEDGEVLETAQNITGATATNPVVVTCAGHGYSNGDEVYISGVAGMTRLNGRYFLVENVTANTFELSSINGTPINGTAYSAYSSGGTVARVYELTTPYDAADLPNMVADQQQDTMYITCAKTADGSYRPQKLTRSGHASWAISDVSFIDGPFYPENTSTTTISLSGTGTAITMTASTATFATTDVGRQVRWHDGTNYFWYTITSYTSATQVNASRGSAATPGGTAATKKWALGVFTDTLGWPKLVTFYENRAVYGNTDTFPATLFGSKSAEVSSDFDTFTPGTDDTSPYTYRISSGQSNALRFLKGTDQFLMAGTFGAEHRINGGSNDAAITPTNISVKAFSYLGVAGVQPPVADNNVMYLRRNRRTIASIVYDPLRDGYLSDDKTVLSSHITKGYVERMGFQAGPPNILWGVRGDGVLIGMTYEQRQQVLAWHRHRIADGDAVVEDATVVPQPEGPDRVWLRVKLTSPAGNTVRFIIYMGEAAEYPDRDDYIFTIPATNKPADCEAAEAADDAIFYQDMFEAQKQAFHVDCGLTYDGSKQSVSLTPGTGADTLATTGVVFTAGGAIFTSADVGREVWSAAGGRGIITAYTSPTMVECTIREAFTTLATIDAGSWYFTTDTVRGLDHLEGFEVRAVTDGGATHDLTVSDGAVTLPQQASVVHVGLYYSGLLITNELGGQAADGSTDGRVRTASEAALYFSNTGGCSIGTNPYRMEPFIINEPSQSPGRPPALVTGWKMQTFSGNASPNLRLYIRQENSQPCTIQSIRITTDAKSFVLRG